MLNKQTKKVTDVLLIKKWKNDIQMFKIPLGDMTDKRWCTKPTINGRRGKASAWRPATINRLIQSSTHCYPDYILHSDNFLWLGSTTSWPSKFLTKETNISWSMIPLRIWWIHRPLPGEEKCSWSTNCRGYVNQYSTPKSTCHILKSPALD